LLDVEDGLFDIVAADVLVEIERAVAVAGASVGGYFLFSDRGSDPTGPTGSLGTIDLSLIGR